jgi:hypothetical protein
VCITGASQRGLLFGVGRLLREMRLHYEEKYSSAMLRICTLGSDSLSVLSGPKYKMRQHQIAFRPKTNTYDAFSFKQMRREVLELVFFGGTDWRFIIITTRYIHSHATYYHTLHHTLTRCRQRGGNHSTRTG